LRGVLPEVKQALKFRVFKTIDDAIGTAQYIESQLTKDSLYDTEKFAVIPNKNNINYNSGMDASLSAADVRQLFDRIKVLEREKRRPQGSRYHKCACCNKFGSHTEDECFRNPANRRTTPRENQSSASRGAGSGHQKPRLDHRKFAGQYNFSTNKQTFKNVRPFQSPSNSVPFSPRPDVRQPIYRGNQGHRFPPRNASKPVVSANFSPFNPNGDDEHLIASIFHPDKATQTTDVQDVATQFPECLDISSEEEEESNSLAESEGFEVNDDEEMEEPSDEEETDEIDDETFREHFPNIQELTESTLTTNPLLCSQPTYDFTGEQSLNTIESSILNNCMDRADGVPMHMKDSPRSPTPRQSSVSSNFSPPTISVHPVGSTTVLAPRQSAEKIQNIIPGNTISRSFTVPLFRSLLVPEDASEPGPSTTPSLPPAVSLLPRRRQFAKKSITQTMLAPPTTAESQIAFESELADINFEISIVELEEILAENNSEKQKKKQKIIAKLKEKQNELKRKLCKNNGENLEKKKSRKTKGKARNLCKIKRKTNCIKT